ncbi:MAG: dihydropteroate synthase [Chromatiaceae bacterium]|nr:dihydropteroate synthase [Chromatiaceae bacterium]MCP5314351.1 dihydropteroate synthase [Chromatiaceae bacterium]
MGILNVTPDSFSDGGRFVDLDDALRQAEQMAEQGADIIDVGGESTRPGAAAVGLDEEMARVLPVIERLRAALDLPLSIDTSKPEVMRAAVAAGAAMINDVSALHAPGAIEAAAETGAAVCLMHMQGEPRTMQSSPQYDDVVADILKYLDGRIAACVAGGVARGRLLVDPGFGFGKTLAHNLALLGGLERFRELGLPVLVGISRKSMLGAVTGRDVDERLAASIAAAVMAVERGASVIRVHDVAATVDALRLWCAVRDQQG